MKYLSFFNIIIAIVLYKTAEYKLQTPYFTYYGLFFFIGLLFLNFFLLIFWKFEKLKILGIIFLLIPIFNFFSGFIIHSLNINDNLFPRLNKNETKEVLIKNNTGFNLDIDNKFKFSTDYFGFRKNTYKKINYQNKNSNHRIVIFGASTTLNDHLDDRLTWSNLLQQKLNSSGLNTEIINTGINGLTARQNYKTLLGMSRYQIDTAIFLIGANDWHLQLRNPKKVESIFYYLFNIEDTILYQFTRNIRDKIPIFNNTTSAPGMELTKNQTIIDLEKSSPKLKRKYLIKKVSADFNYHVNKIINICNKKKIRCIFLTQPNIFYDELDEKYNNLLQTNYLKNEDMAKLTKLYNDFLLSKEEKNILVFDLDSKIEKNILYFRDDIHFTKLGAEKVSSELFDFLIERIL